ncbi:MAG: o-succinylbenzoate synthase [Urechidicola sp.]|jgi:o-succinylbenzoate synthase
MKATFQKHILNFKQASGTSRGILRTKETFFLFISNESSEGIGECGLFRGLSIDDRDDYEEKLQWLCENINSEKELLLLQLTEFPSIQFGLEQALKSLESKDKFQLFPSNFTEGIDSIPINGLIWMGSDQFMHQQIKEKLESGFTTIKMKIGAIDFNTELSLLKSIRKEYNANEIELRVDANGAFDPKEALEKLKRLSEMELHSIEQPIKQGQWQEMARLCEETPLDIALDEELIGIFAVTKKEELLLTVNPQYIILKPSLIGGIGGSNEWINLSNSHNVAWWITSALESNVGLNAIAQFTYDLGVKIPQGLGTGGLFTNNFDSPLEIKKGELHYNKNKDWNFNLK